MQRAMRLVVAVLVVAGCSKSETESKLARPNAPIAVPVRKAEAGAADSAVDESLKERLARQDAASRMFERNVLQPPPPKSAEPKAAPALPDGASSPAEVVQPSPVAETAKPPAAAEVSKASPVAEAPKAPPRVDVAAAKPATAPEAATRLLSRVEPDFPAEAYRAGISTGTVMARMTLDGAGGVTRVEIIDASPHRVFDRAVMKALAQWKFTEGAAGRTVDSEIEFKR